MNCKWRRRLIRTETDEDFILSPWSNWHKGIWFTDGWIASAYWAGINIISFIKDNAEYEYLCE